ncbi:MAG: DUF4038 domain-containing protein [Bryobacterales bacterium]|nr:DUF4038 domain-containing protein [Bryobacterales bacterium]
MPLRALLLLVAASALLWGQPTCPPTAIYSPCDLALELTAEEQAAHPNPYATVELYAEFRSPGIDTYRLPMFWDGGGRFVARFAPTAPGKWLVRFSGNIPRLDGMMTSVEAVDAPAPGFLEPANVHHWRTSRNLQPHLWMGDTQYTFATIPDAIFEAILAKRKEQRFTHVRGSLLGPRPADAANASGSPLPAADQILPAHFQQVDRRVRALNAAGMVVDLILGWDRNQLAEILPTSKDRQRYLNYVIARYAAFNVTWQLVQEFEEYKDGKRLMKEMGDYLRERDPYKHPRSTHTVSTTSPLVRDGWMNYLLYQSSNDQLGAIEHQLYQLPAVNAEFAYENSGAGATHPHHVDSDTFRHRLWNATMDGQYPTFGNTGTYGGSFPVQAKYADSPGATAMKVWFDLLSRTRYWELEPYFDVSGARCVGLHGEDAPEFVCYVEPPAGAAQAKEVEIRFAKKHKYNIEWINPADGAVTPLKEYKEQSWAGAPPDSGHDWVLHFYRDGYVQGLSNKYKFESRYVPVQEPETALAKIPFELVEPAKMEVPLAGGWTAPYRIKVTRESRATRSMMYLLTAEDTVAGEGARVAATGPEGFLQFDPRALGKPPVAVNLRVYGMNVAGKVYVVDKVFRLEP